MIFTAVGFSPLPDIETARHNYHLQDLDDEDVAKVLFHRRKQSGNGEELGWDQLRFGTLSLLRLDERDARIETLSLREAPETDLVDSVFRALQDGAPLVAWKPGFIPLLQFRCLKLRRTAADYWEHIPGKHPPYLNLQQELGLDSPGEKAPSLQEMAERLFLPGLQGLAHEHLWDHWQAADYPKVVAHADYEAINTALLALEIFHLKGRLSEDDLLSRREILFELLTTPPLEQRFSPLTAHWKQNP